MTSYRYPTETLTTEDQTALQDALAAVGLTLVAARLDTKYVRSITGAVRWDLTSAAAADVLKVVRTQWNLLMEDLELSSWDHRAGRNAVVEITGDLDEDHFLGFAAAHMTRIAGDIAHSTMMEVAKQSEQGSRPWTEGGLSVVAVHPVELLEMVEAL